MINPTLSLLKLLSQNGFGTLSKDLFWEQLELGKVGVYITSIGEAQDIHTRRVQQFELIARGDTKVSGYTKLAQIVEFLNNSYSSICTLPPVQNKAGETVCDEIGNVTITPLSTISNSGLDSEGKTIWNATGRIEY